MEDSSTFQFPKLCQYKDILGKPNEGIRNQFRVFNISVIDVILTIVLGLLLAKIFKVTKFSGVILSFLLSILFHKIFCVDTTISKLLQEKFNF
jgi:hypothetical protein